MSFNNFKPQVWSNEVMTQLERKCVFAGLTNRQYEGEVRNAGDSVRILGVARPTISKAITTNFELADPEEVPTSATVLNINQIDTFNYMVGDIDQQQMKGNLKPVLSGETTNALAEKIDSYIAGMALTKEAKLMNASALKIDTTNILTELDKAWQHLVENNVPTSETINVVMSPRFWVLLKQKIMDLDTDNSKLIKTGQMAKYSNMNLIMSNAVATTNSGAVDNIMVMSEKAIAYVNSLTKTEAYRPEKRMADAIKGFTLYDAKIVRPKELLVMNVKYA